MLIELIISSANVLKMLAMDFNLKQNYEKRLLDITFVARLTGYFNRFVHLLVKFPSLINSEIK